jgi:hypothetical protein
MKLLICSLILCLGIASSATGGDSVEMSRDYRMVCSLFVIEDPFPATSWEPMNHCCVRLNRIRDCYVNDWDEKAR